jgi:hypothetical protein
MTLHLIPLNFLKKEGNFILFFISVMTDLGSPADEIVDHIVFLLPDGAPQAGVPLPIPAV